MNDSKRLRRVSAHDLVGLRLPGALAVSPEGERIAFELAEVDFEKNEVRTQILVAPGGDRDDVVWKSRPLTRGLDDASSPAWSPDGSYLAFLGFRAQPGEDEEDDRREDGELKHQVFVVDRDGGDARRVTNAVEGVSDFRLADGGRAIVTLGRAPRPAAERSWRRQRREQLDDAHVVGEEIPRHEIWLHPLQGKSKQLLGPRRGIESFDLSPDGSKLVYATNHTGRPEDSEKCEAILVDLKTGEERRLSGGRGGSETGPRFTRDGAWILFEGWNDPLVSFSRQELFAVPVDREAEPRELLASVDRDLESFDLLPDGRALAVVAEAFGSRLVIVDPSSGTTADVPIEGRIVDGVDVGESGVVGAVVESGTSLPEVAFVDPQSGKAEALTDLNPEAETWRRGKRERVEWESGGLRHEGLFIAPSTERGEGEPPLVVWIHGGPHWRVVDTLRVYEAEALAAEGFAVFLPQYRGSSGYGESYALASRGDLGGADARDILDGVERVCELGWADSDRVALAGASYGGYMTNWLLATTDRFRAGVSISGIFDLQQDWATSDYSSWEIHYLGAPPWEASELYRERSPITKASTLTAPVLILHGLDDDNTLFTNSKGLYRALNELGRDPELVLYPREGHGLFEPAHRVDAVQRILDWLHRHVGGEVGATHVYGREVAQKGLALLPLGHSVKKEYAGVRPIEGRVFLEVSIQLTVRIPEADSIRILPCGASADLVLVDEHGDLYRPIGVPLSTHGHAVLFSGRGALEAWKSEDDEHPTLPATVVFEVPEEPAVYRLRALDLPPVALDVRPEPPEEGGSGEEPGGR